eukprot:10723515-Alexandrium_andersonii.AAC.1
MGGDSPNVPLRTGGFAQRCQDHARRGTSFLLGCDEPSRLLSEAGAPVALPATGAREAPPADGFAAEMLREEPA